MKTIFQANIIIIVACLLLFLCFSCNIKRQVIPMSEAPSTRKVPVQVQQPQIGSKQPDKQKGIDHYVRWHGETLSIIAKWYTGSIKNWKTLASINTGINSNLLYINNRIHIPAKLIKTKIPMPKKFLDQFYQKKKVKIVPKSNDDIPLFGPKTYPAK